MIIVPPGFIDTRLRPRLPALVAASERDREGNWDNDEPEDEVPDYETDETTHHRATRRGRRGG